MAIAKSILFLDDRLHSSVATSSITSVTSTADGNIHNVRDANLLTSWKPNDSAGTGENFIVDLGGTAQLGAAAGTAYIGVAYDPRSIDQTKIWFQYDTADDPAFPTPVSFASFTVPTTHLYPTCQWLSFTMPTPAKRYWRVLQPTADRGGGTRTIRIYYLGMFATAGVLNLDTDHEKSGPAAGRYGQIGLTGIDQTPAGILSPNALTFPVQSFDFGANPASVVIWQQIRDGMFRGDVNARAFFVQFEGLRNEAMANFYLARAERSDLASSRGKVERMEASIPFITEAFV